MHLISLNTKDSTPEARSRDQGVPTCGRELAVTAEGRPGGQAPRTGAQNKVAASSPVMDRLKTARRGI